MSREQPLRAEQLGSALRGIVTSRSVIVGVGNVDRGDDAFGPAVAQYLRGHGALTAIDAGACPENHLGLIASARPDTVLIVDAAELGAAPGCARLCEAQDVSPGGLSSHAGSLGLVALYTAARTDASCWLLLVQPATLTGPAPQETANADAADPLARLSPEVQVAARAVCRAVVAAALVG